jgi:8-amino-7-oxononanoate synthase
LNSTEDFIKTKLGERKTAGTYRALKAAGSLVDFCSNDYLGFARSKVLKALIEKEMASHPAAPNGSTGSRLLSGQTSYAEDLEKSIADIHNAETGLLYNSGYDANVGLFSSLPQKGDTIIMDELSHASIIDGARLSFASRFSFRHNSLPHLEEKLKHLKGNCYVVVESVYSMDGDTPPIMGIISLCEKYGAKLIVDEAHATGLYYNGLISQLHLEDRVFARIVTFGKALGCHGAIILGSNLLREYLINFSRSFIYTTAAPFHQLASVKMAYDFLSSSSGEIQRLRDHIGLFRQKVRGLNLMQSDSAIQCLVIGGNKRTRELADQVQDAGFDIRPILSPTVAEGTERLRVCLHSFNTDNEIIALAQHLTRITHA